MRPAHKPGPGAKSANKCDACRTHFPSARNLVNHLYYNPSHVRKIDLSGAEADQSYRTVGR